MCQPGMRHNIIAEYEILLSTQKVSSKTKVLHFRRANISSLRAQLGGILWKSSMEHKDSSKCWEFFKSNALEAKNQPFDTVTVLTLILWQSISLLFIYYKAAFAKLTMLDDKSCSTCGDSLASPSSLNMLDLNF